MSNVAQFIKQRWVVTVAIFEGLFAAQKYIEFARMQAVDAETLLIPALVAVGAMALVWVTTARLSLGNASAPRFRVHVRAAAAAMLLSGLAAAAFVAYEGVAARRSRLSVAVARFEQVGHQYEFHQFIQETLMPLRCSDLEILAASTTITYETTDKLREMRRLKLYPDALIWGRYATTAQSGAVYAHLEPLDVRKADLARLQSAITLDAMEFAGPKVKARLASEMRMAVLLALGALRFRENKLSEAATAVEDSIRTAEQLQAQSPVALPVGVKAYRLAAAIYYRVGDDAGYRRSIEGLRRLRDVQATRFQALLPEWRSEAPREVPKDRLLSMANYELAKALEVSDPAAALAAYQEAIRFSPRPTPKMFAKTDTLRRQLRFQPRVAALY